MAVGVLTLVIVAAITVVLTRSDDAPSSEADSAPPACAVRVGDGPMVLDGPAPSFRLPGLEGGCVDLGALRGQPVVLNFWASWCNPCRREFPLLRDALEARADDGLAVVGIVYRDISSDARAFAGEFGATWALALDEDSKAARAYGVRAIPQTFFIRRDGTVARRVFGLTTARGLGRHLDEITATDG